MKRFLYLFIAFLLMTISMNAQHVSEGQALQKAQEFLNKKVMTQTSGKNRAPRKLRSLAKVSQSDAYYIFNAESNGGFVIVSGDERTEEILGFSTEGNINLTNMPENMKGLLQSYEQQIKAIPANARNVRATVSLHPAIAPMLDSFWGQGAPFNLQCPEIEGQPTVTGCVATALAQIMYYHKWPEGYTTEIPAYDYTLSSWNNETQSWDNPNTEALPATQFDWDAMTNVYYGNASEASKDAVAKLMRYCGQAFWMKYGTSESGTNLGFYRNLHSYFGYSDKVRLADFSYYSPTEWDELIYNELKCNRPVLYSSSSFFGNHAYVCDGYDGGGYYHMNLGYEGDYNGWYRLRILNGNHNLDYVGFGWPEPIEVQPAVIVGIQKPDIEASDPMTLTTTASLKYDSNAKTFLISCYNLLEIDQTIESGIRCYNTTTGNVDFEYSGQIQLQASQYGSATIPTSVCTFSEGVRYRLCPIWRQAGEDDWHVVDAQSIEVMMWSGNLIEQVRSGLGAMIDVIGQLVVGSYNWAIVTINNNGDLDYKNNVAIDVIDKTSGKTIQHDEYYACLASGEQCKIKVVLDNNYNEGYYEIRVNVNYSQIASQEFHISKKIDVKMSGDDWGWEYAPKFDWKTKTFRVFVVNNDSEYSYDKYVLGYISPRTIYAQEPVGLSSPYFKDCQVIKSEKLHINPGDSVWVTIPCGDVNVDLLSSAVFVVSQNIDEERYESYNGDYTASDRYWEWDYGYFATSDIYGNIIAEYTKDYIKMYDEFAYGNNNIDNYMSMVCHVIDDESKICFAELPGGRDGNSIVIPGKVKHPVKGEWYSVIGLDNIFSNNVKEIVIGEGITSLKEDISRSYNDKLESFILPATLNHLANNSLVLAATPNLKRIYCKAIVPPVIENYQTGNHDMHGLLYEGWSLVQNHPSGETNFVSKADYSDITLYVPKGSGEAYAKAWSSFVNIVEMDEEDMPLTNSPIGDVDWDLEVDVADIQSIIKIILGYMNGTSTEDVNGDGKIDIADIQNIINIIVNNANAQSNVKGIVSMDCTGTTNNDYLGYKQACDKIDVGLSNNLTYSAFQMKVTLPEGVDIASVEFNKERLDGFTKLVKKMDEQQYLVMGYSMEGYIIEGDEGNLLTINTKGNGNVIINDVVFSTPDAISYQLRVIGDEETGVKDIAVTRVHSYGNTVYINIAYPQEMSVYSIGGQLVKKISLASGLNSFTLPKGQYIINNQKVIIDK